MANGQPTVLDEPSGAESSSFEARNNRSLCGHQDWHNKDLNLRPPSPSEWLLTHWPLHRGETATTDPDLSIRIPDGGNGIYGESLSTPSKSDTSRSCRFYSGNNSLPMNIDQHQLQLLPEDSPYQLLNSMDLNCSAAGGLNIVSNNGEESGRHSVSSYLSSSTSTPSGSGQLSVVRELVPFTVRPRRWNAAARNNNANNEVSASLWGREPERAFQTCGNNRLDCNSEATKIRPCPTSVPTPSNFAAPHLGDFINREHNDDPAQRLVARSNGGGATTQFLYESSAALGPSNSSCLKRGGPEFYEDNEKERKRFKVSSHNNGYETAFNGKTEQADGESFESAWSGHFANESHVRSYDVDTNTCKFIPPDTTTNSFNSPTPDPTKSYCRDNLDTGTTTASSGAASPSSPLGIKPVSIVHTPDADDHTAAAAAVAAFIKPDEGSSHDSDTMHDSILSSSGAFSSRPGPEYSRLSPFSTTDFLTTSDQTRYNQTLQHTSYDHHHHHHHHHDSGFDVLTVEGTSSPEESSGTRCILKAETSTAEQTIYDNFGAYSVNADYDPTSVGAAGYYPRGEQNEGSSSEFFNSRAAGRPIITQPGSLMTHGTPVLGQTTNLESLSLEHRKLLKNIPRKSREAFSSSDLAAFRTCHPHYSRNCFILMQNGFDIRLGEVGRAAIKKEISRRLKGDAQLRERCVTVVCRLKNANVLQLLQMAEISGCLTLGLKISSCYWKEYSKKQQRPSTSNRRGSCSATTIPPGLPQSPGNTCYSDDSSNSSRVKHNTGILNQESQQQEDEIYIQQHPAQQHPSLYPSVGSGVISSDTPLLGVNRTSAASYSNGGSYSTAFTSSAARQFASMAPFSLNNDTSSVSTSMLVQSQQQAFSVTLCSNKTLEGNSWDITQGSRSLLLPPSTVENNNYCRQVEDPDSRHRRKKLPATDGFSVTSEKRRGRPRKLRTQTDDGSMCQEDLFSSLVGCESLFQPSDSSVVPDIEKHQMSGSIVESLYSLGGVPQRNNNGLVANSVTNNNSIVVGGTGDDTTTAVMLPQQYSSPYKEEQDLLPVDAKSAAVNFMASFSPSALDPVSLSRLTACDGLLVTEDSSREYSYAGGCSSSSSNGSSSTTQHIPSFTNVSTGHHLHSSKQGSTSPILCNATQLNPVVVLSNKIDDGTPNAANTTMPADRSDRITGQSLSAGAVWCKSTEEEYNSNHYGDGDAETTGLALQCIEQTSIENGSNRSAATGNNLSNENRCYLSNRLGMASLNRTGGSSRHHGSTICINEASWNNQAGGLGGYSLPAVVANRNH